jgi:hypothetical protein
MFVKQAKMCKYLDHFDTSFLISHYNELNLKLISSSASARGRSPPLEGRSRQQDERLLARRRQQKVQGIFK